MGEIGMILTVQRRLIFGKGYWEKPSEPILCETLRKTSTRNMVRRMSYDKLISVNLVWKLHFEKSQWRRSQNY